MEAITSSLIDNIETYQQLITTLALGAAAGTFALLVQITFHNLQHGNRIALQPTWLVLLAILCQILAIVFGVVTKSALVASIPALYAIKWGEESATKYLSDAGLSHILFWSQLQILAFGLGIVLLFVVLLLNIGLLREERTPPQAP